MFGGAGHAPGYRGGLAGFNQALSAGTSEYGPHLADHLAIYSTKRARMRVTKTPNRIMRDTLPRPCTKNSFLPVVTGFESFRTPSLNGHRTARRASLDDD